MPRVTRKKARTINMDEYISLLMQLKGKALKEWNRESTRRSTMLQKEIFESSKANVDRFLGTPGADRTLAKQGKHTEALPVIYEIDVAPGLCRLRVSVGNRR